MRGLQGNHNEIREMLIQNQKIAIFSLTELFIADTVAVDFNIQGYGFVKRGRKNGNGGGVGAYIGNGMIFNIRQDLDDTLIWKESGLKSFQNLINHSYLSSFISLRILPTTCQNTSQQSYWKKLKRINSEL